MNQELKLKKEIEHDSWEEDTDNNSSFSNADVRLSCAVCISKAATPQEKKYQQMRMKSEEVN